MRGVAKLDYMNPRLPAASSGTKINFIISMLALTMRTIFFRARTGFGERARVRNVSDKGAVIERFKSIIGLSSR